MIIIPKLNLFSRSPSWQQNRIRRLRLLGFVGPEFWSDDLELLRYYGPDDVLAPWHAMIAKRRKQITSILRQRGFITATVNYGDSGTADTLTLNALSDSDSSATLALAIIQFQRGGNVTEGGVAQNPTAEWIDNASATIGDDYEAKIDHTSGFAYNYVGGTWADNVFNIIDENLSITIAHGGPLNNTRTGLGTATVRELANTANSVSASTSLSATYTGSGGIVVIP